MEQLAAVGIIIFLLFLRARTPQAASPAASTPNPTPVSSSASQLNAAPVVTYSVDTIEEDDADTDSTQGSEVLQLSPSDPSLWPINPVTGLAIPQGPPPIPTEASEYSQANGYTGWTLALAQQNINAIDALANADRSDEAAAESILDDPNVAGDPSGDGDPALDAYSAYYTPNAWATVNT